MATDHHAAVRAAVKGVLDTYAAALTPALTVYALDDLEGDIGLVTAVPAVAVACVGPEQDRPEFGTNRSSGRAFACVVALLGTGQGNGAHSPSMPDLTRFRADITDLFHLKRLPAVPQVGYCEVSGDALLLDREGAAFQRLSTYLTVVAVGRFPRS